MYTFVEHRPVGAHYVYPPFGYKGGPCWFGGYSVYRDEAGETVYFRDRPLGEAGLAQPNALTSVQACHAAAEDDLPTDDAHDLIDHALQPYTDLTNCATCDAVVDADDAYPVDGDTMCEPCRSLRDIVVCGRCDEMVTYWSTVEGDAACRDCTDCDAHYCDECDGVVWSEGDHYENHDEEDSSTGCCDAPNQTFSIPSYAAAHTENDTMVSVSVTDNLVRGSGIDRIYEVLAAYRGTLDEATRPEWRYLSAALRSIGREYKNEGGVFAKRLRSAVYKRTKEVITHCEEHDGLADTCAAVALSLPPELVSKIGQIARDHSTPLDLELAITRDLNRSAYDFGHEESCWWSDYAHSRCTLKSNAGFGLRSFGGRGDWDVTGRTWVIPCAVSYVDQWGAQLKPTSGEAHAYIVFNGYGDLSETRGAQALAAMTGLSVSQNVDFSPGNDAMYVNAGAYIVASPELLAMKLHAPDSMSRHGAPRDDFAPWQETAAAYEAGRVEQEAKQEAEAEAFRAKVAEMEAQMMGS